MSILSDRPKQETPMNLEQESEQLPKEQPKEIKQETPKESTPEQEIPKEILKKQSSKEQEYQSKQEKKKIKFLHTVPKFVGRELEVYGPFESGETEELPLELAKILIVKGMAEEAT